MGLSGNTNLRFIVNDGSAYNPLHNLGHSTHYTGESIDQRFITSDGVGNNNVNTLSQSNRTLNGEFVTTLQNHGFSINYSDQGTIPGTTHAAGHVDHLHTARPGSTTITNRNVQQQRNASNR